MAQTESKLVFEASVGETGRGDVAIDTVRVSDGPCVIMPGVAALDKYTGCSFNADMCGYLAQNVPADTVTSQAGRSNNLQFYIEGFLLNIIGAGFSGQFC